MKDIIAANIKRIRQNIPDGVKYVVVSKFRPLEQLQAAYDAGERVFAESRPAELVQKVASLPSDIQWHFIGHLQTNKLKMVLPHCSLVQSVDSVHLMEAMERYCAANALQVDILMEVHVAKEEAKQGFSPEECLEFYRNESWKAFPHLNFCGLMAMASFTEDTGRIEADFALAKELYDTVCAMPCRPPHFTELSIGMSQDYTLAIKHGSTMVRVGSATFEDAVLI